MLYVYAATQRNGGQRSLQGIDDSPVELLPFGPIAMAFSRHKLRPEPTAKHIAAHHRVTIALAGAGGAVPFRFGNVFVDERELRRKLEQRAQELSAAVDRLAGCVEMTVRLSSALAPATGEGTSHAHPGTAYLRAKRNLAEAELRLKGDLAGIVKDWRRSQQGSEVRLACLVELDRVPELQTHLTGLALTGPWAPSSFV